MIKFSKILTSCMFGRFILKLIISQILVCAWLNLLYSRHLCSWEFLNSWKLLSVCCPFTWSLQGWNFPSFLILWMLIFKQMNSFFRKILKFSFNFYYFSLWPGRTEEKVRAFGLYSVSSELQMFWLLGGRDKISFFSFSLENESILSPF